MMENSSSLLPNKCCNSSLSRDAESRGAQFVSLRNATDTGYSSGLHHLLSTLSLKVMGRLLDAAGFKWTRALVAVLLLCGVSATLAQTETLNIDCGATLKYTDAQTGLTWVPDTGYISTGKSLTLSTAVPASLGGFTEMTTLRYFDDRRAKNCYTLPVTPCGIYLLKLTFFYGGYDNSDTPPTFQVSLDATVVTNITGSATTATFKEYHYMTMGNVSYVCLLPYPPGNAASPFISGISIREASVLATGYAAEYNTEITSGAIMETCNRVNFGENDLVRAPDDYYDRLWFPEGPGSKHYLTPTLVPYNFSSTTSSFPTSTKLPPSRVMQTAVSVPSACGVLQTYLMSEGFVSEVTAVYLSFHYAELNKSACPLKRDFSLQVPGLLLDAPEINMSSVFLEQDERDFSMRGVVLTNTTTAILTPLSSSQTGPTLNCLEVFSRSDPQTTKTIDRDALAIEDIKASLNLTEWTGDPCLPYPHSWLTCSNPDTPSGIGPSILMMNLSGFSLQGPIPASLTELWDLTSLDLSNNDLSGTLPDFLTTMTALRVLAVRNNNLSGPIPAALVAPNSQIRFSFSGNPLLGTAAPGASPGVAPGVPPQCVTNCKKKSNIAVIAGASAGGVLALIVIAAIALLTCRRCQRNRKLLDEQRAGMRIVTRGGAKAYTFAEVTTMTSQFKRELGKGGFGPVYYGKLPDGQEVAVKVADASSKQGNREFFSEVDVLSQVHHRNLVALVGYCQDKKHILIYKYMENGSLFDHLHGNARDSDTLNWRTRLNIALNAAQGLEYLHTACSPSLIHRDVKSSNILLTLKYEAKVADFGLARLLAETEDTRVMTDVMGTAGYLDPEYYSTHYISPKSDVYSFGIVLLELITGCLPIDRSAPEGRHPNLVIWVRENLQRNNITTILDPAVQASNPNQESLWRVAEIAMESVEPKGEHRPTMTEVVQELLGALQIEGANTTSPRLPSGYSGDFTSGNYEPTTYPAAR